MKALKECPKVLFRKVIFTAMVGVGVLLFGGAYFLFSKDGTTLMLSGAILAFSLVRSWELYRIVRGKSYDVVEGTCVAIKSRPLRKQFSVKVMDGAGTESTLRLAKGAKVKIGSRYRFYFTPAHHLSLNNEYLDAALSHGNFLGYEDLGDILEVQGKERPPCAE